MKKYLKRIYHIILAFIAGMMMLCVIMNVLNITADRIGNCGGELLLIPLFILIFAIGFDAGRYYFKDLDARKIARRGFEKGYQVGTTKTIEEFLSENKKLLK